jgi:uncharacterized membrane protein
MNAPTSKETQRSWEDTLALSWRPALLVALGGLAAALVIWSLLNINIIVDYVTAPTNEAIRNSQLGARAQLNRFVQFAMIPVVLAWGWLIWRTRKHQTIPSLRPLWLVVAAIPLPLLQVPGFEFAHTYLAGLAILGLAFAAARNAETLPQFFPTLRGELTNRHAWIAVLGGWIAFTLVMGFIAHWRFITFHAEPYDTSWETNAVAGILRTGLPSISVGGGDFYFDGQRMPVPYFDTHTPFIYYLYAPFYAIYKDPRTLLWLQALHMGSGSLGMYLFARKWLRNRNLAVVLAFAYLLHPSVQGHCLHDFHANSLAIPTLMIALGLMEAGWWKWALVAAFATAICREDTPLYAVCIGLFWTFGSRNRLRIRSGIFVVVGCAVIFLFVTQWLMIHFGGKPRWTHFSLYFNERQNADSLLRGILFNPLGALVATIVPYKVEYAWLSLLPFGLVALLGWRGGWFLLTPLALMVATEHRDFFAAGMNYSAPLIPAVLVMGVLGVRAWLLRRPCSALKMSDRRWTIGVFVLTSAVFANHIYGNILAKTYKLEYGMWPYRRAVRYHFDNQIGYVPNLPAYGARERALWEVIAHVPWNVPISTSWSMNPQLSNREIAYHWPFMGAGHQAEAQAKCVVLDKLPPIMDRALEADINKLRIDPTWQVTFENRWGVIFERR